MSRLSLSHLFRMVGQKKISEFFTTAAFKRKSSCDKIECQVSPKKRKENYSSNGELAEKSNFSEDLSQKVEDNRIQAKIKLQTKKTPILSKNIGLSWYKALEPEFSKPYFLKLNEFVTKEREKYTIYPLEDEIFTWTTLCDIKEIKVVMIGQDPYHSPRQAHGLCFSVKDGVSFPPSLINIFKEMETDLNDFEIPKNGDLSKWASQGVLLLNACLTVRAHNPNSHKDQGWEIFTDAVIKWFNENLNNVVFLLWGSYAQGKGKCINTKKHHVLKCAHPSPLSAYRGFFGCKHFSKTNELLIKEGRKPIDWKL